MAKQKCNPTIVSAASEHKFGDLENENSLTVNKSKESDIKERVKNLHLKLSNNRHSKSTSLQK